MNRRVQEQDCSHAINHGTIVQKPLCHMKRCAPAQGSFSPAAVQLDHQ